MNRNRVTQKDILFLSISFFVIVIVWVSFNIYHTWVTSTISEDLQVQITPIDPNFDIETIHTLEAREDILPLFQNSSNFEASPETLTPTPTASNSSEFVLPEISPTAEPEITIEPEPTL